MDSENMPPVDFKKDKGKVSFVQRHFIGKIVNFNVTRVAAARIENKRVNLFGLGLGLFALSIYGYTMYAVRQETFLDDFEVPEAYVGQIQSS